MNFLDIDGFISNGDEGERPNLKRSREKSTVSQLSCKSVFNPSAKLGTMLNPGYKKVESKLTESAKSLENLLEYFKSRDD